MNVSSQTEQSSVAQAAEQPEQRPAAARIAGMVAGDAISFLVFAGVGRESHGEASGIAAIAQVALTASPFALGWFAVSPWLGAFRRARTSTPKSMLRTTLVAWLAAWPATLLLRWAFTQQVPPFSFAIVILLANTVFLSAWRGTFALVSMRIKGRA